jgi:hypothetical protein
MFLCIPLLDYILPLMRPDAYILMGRHHLQQCCYINLERLSVAVRATWITTELVLCYLFFHIVK